MAYFKGRGLEFKGKLYAYYKQAHKKSYRIQLNIPFRILSDEFIKQNVPACFKTIPFVFFLKWAGLYRNKTNTMFYYLFSINKVFINRTFTFLD